MADARNVSATTIAGTALSIVPARESGDATIAKSSLLKMVKSVGAMMMDVSNVAVRLSDLIDPIVYVLIRIAGSVDQRHPCTPIVCLMTNAMHPDAL